MQITFVVLLLIVLFAKSRPTGWNEYYMGKETTSTINGLFIWLVFLSHFTQYLPSSYGNIVSKTIGQLVVVMFLFYSGYGCSSQYLVKGEPYLQSFPKKRILPTFVNFDIAVCVFVFVDFLLGKPLTVRQILLSFVCWDSVGNSNWYIFVIMLCYALFWLSACVLKKKSGGNPQRWQVIFMHLLAISVFALSRVRPGYWCDTMMAFGAGAVYGLYRSRIEEFVKKNYLLCLMIAAVLFVSVKYIPIIGQRYWIAHNMKSIAFAAIVVMATMKISVDCAVLRWSGEHLFPLYIYQRIPMIVFSTLFPVAFRDVRCWIYFAISACIAITLASLYPCFQFRGSKS